MVVEPREQNMHIKAKFESLKVPQQTFFETFHIMIQKTFFEIPYLG